MRILLLMVVAFCVGCAVAAELLSFDVPTIPGCGEKIKVLAALSDAGIRAPQDVRIATWANKGNVPIYARSLSRIEIDPWKNAAQTYAFCRAVLSGERGVKPSILAPAWIAGETLGGKTSSVW